MDLIQCYLSALSKPKGLSRLNITVQSKSIYEFIFIKQMFKQMFVIKV